MPPSPLTEDEFRLLAYVRSYADRCEQHLSPDWVQQQLEFSLSQMQDAARGLATRGLAEFFEFQPPEEFLREHPEITAESMPTDIRLTQAGWDYLRHNRDG
jgi:hypothetical protein